MPDSKDVNAARLIALLWREPRSAAKTRGPKPGLSADRVIRAAIRIADAQGLEQLTIRRVAERLKVAPMSVYTYVPGKAELFALMLDAVYAGMKRQAPAADDWRARITAVAADNRRLYTEHPWIALLPPNRPPLGPGTIGKYEYELAALDGVGLSDVELDAALTFVLGFVESCAQAAARARAAVAESAQTDAQWWADYEPVLERVLDASRYPLGTRVGTASAQAQGGAYDGDRAYAFGLTRVLDGLAALIESGSNRKP